MQEQLKPCPFCGGNPEKTKRKACHSLEGKLLYSWQIRCSSCGATIRAPENSEDYAVDLWNGAVLHRKRERSKLKMPDMENLKTLARKATPGAWCQVGYCGIGVSYAGGAPGGVPSPVAGAQREEDAAYIAAASPQVVLGLIAETEQLENLVASYRTLAETVGKLCDCLLKENVND